jgi:hypothetical protein
MSKITKQTMIECINFYFEKQGKRMTNLKKSTIPNLKAIIDKYSIDIDNIKNLIYEEKQEEKKQEEEHYKLLNIEREKREKLIAKNEITFKLFIPYIKQLEKEENKINYDLDLLKFRTGFEKRTGNKIGNHNVIETENGFNINGINIEFVSRGEKYYDKWMLKPKFISKGKKIIPIII